MGDEAEGLQTLDFIEAGRGIVSHVTHANPDSLVDASADGPMLAIYGRTVTWKHLIITAVLLLILMGVGAAFVTWWIWQNMAAQVVLKEQQADIVLPKELAVQAAVNQRVRIQVDQTLPVRVPIHQDLTIPLKEAIPINVSIDTMVPISIDVPIKHVVRVDQVVQLDTQVKTRILGIPVTVPIQGRIPVKAEVPVDLVIPVRQNLPVALVTPATVRLTEPLRTTVDTVIEARIPVHESLSLPVTAPVNATLSFPQQRVRAGLDLLDLTVPFDSVTLAPRTRPVGAR